MTLLGNGLVPIFLKRFNLHEWPYIITDPTLPEITEPMHHFDEYLVHEDEERLLKFYRDDSIRKEKSIHNIIEEILCWPTGTVPTRLASRLSEFIKRYAAWKAYAKTIYVSPQRIERIREGIMKSVKEILDHLEDVLWKKYLEKVERLRRRR